MTVGELGAGDLPEAEQSRIRFAADTLLFCADLEKSPTGRAAFSEMAALSEELVANGRCTSPRAETLLDDLWACGPGVDAVLPVAA
jgi:hypothetical protein